MTTNWCHRWFLSFARFLCIILLVTLCHATLVSSAAWQCSGADYTSSVTIDISNLTTVSINACNFSSSLTITCGSNDTQATTAAVTLYRALISSGDLMIQDCPSFAAGTMNITESTVTNGTLSFQNSNISGTQISLESNTANSFSWSNVTLHSAAAITATSNTAASTTSNAISFDSDSSLLSGTTLTLTSNNGTTSAAGKDALLLEMASDSTTSVMMTSNWFSSSSSSGTGVFWNYHGGQLNASGTNEFSSLNISVATPTTSLLQIHGLTVTETAVVSCDNVTSDSDAQLELLLENCTFPSLQFSGFPQHGAVTFRDATISDTLLFSGGTLQNVSFVFETSTILGRIGYLNNGTLQSGSTFNFTSSSISCNVSSPSACIYSDSTVVFTDAEFRYSNTPIANTNDGLTIEHNGTFGNTSIITETGTTITGGVSLPMTVTGGNSTLTFGESVSTNEPATPAPTPAPTPVPTPVQGGRKMAIQEQEELIIYHDIATAVHRLKHRRQFSTGGLL